MSRPLIFVGSRQCISLLESIAILNDIEVLGIIDHHYYGNKEEINGIPIIGDERWLLQDNTQAKQWIRTCDFFPANYWDGQQYNNQGPNLQKLRQDRINLLDQSGVSVINLIHPNASVYGLKHKSPYFKIGRGVEIADMCCVTLDHNEIGDYCSLQTRSTLSHNVTLGRNVIVGPDAWLCNSNVGDDAYVGMFSKTDPIRLAREAGEIKIGRNSSVWANTLISKDVPDNSVYTTQQRILKKRSSINE